MKKTRIAAELIRKEIFRVLEESGYNTFVAKYGYLPGDIPDPYASQFGFAARGTDVGSGNGDGILQGQVSAGIFHWGSTVGPGETGLFWRDLSNARLIDGSFNSAKNPGTTPGTVTSSTTPNIDNFVPKAQLGQSNYVYAYSGGLQGGGGVWLTNGLNYFGISAISQLLGNSAMNTTPVLTVQQAYNMDKKVDDGFPQTGKVVAEYVNSVVALTLSSHQWNPVWVAGGGAAGTDDTSATTPSSSTCYDNAGVAEQQQYSMTQNNGSGLNCALSFQFSGAGR